jgi:excisionase family DNA binding protein
MLQSTHFHLTGKGMPDWASITVQEASERFGYSEQYLRRLCREKKVENVKIGQVFLIRLSSLEQYAKDAKDAGDSRYGPRS